MGDEHVRRAHVSPAEAAGAQAPVGFFAVAAGQVHFVQVAHFVQRGALDVQAETATGFDLHRCAVYLAGQFIQFGLRLGAGHGVAHLALGKLISSPLLVNGVTEAMRASL